LAFGLRIFCLIERCLHSVESLSIASQNDVLNVLLVPWITHSPALQVEATNL
jgi:hypothetical protein